MMIKHLPTLAFQVEFRKVKCPEYGILSSQLNSQISVQTKHLYEISPLKGEQYLISDGPAIREAI